MPLSESPAFEFSAAVLDLYDTEHPGAPEHSTRNLIAKLRQLQVG